MKRKNGTEEVKGKNMRYQQKPDRCRSEKLPMDRSENFYVMLITLRIIIKPFPTQI